MKNSIKTLVTLSVIGCLFVIWGFSANDHDAGTEQYAYLCVVEKSSRLYIRINVDGEEPRQIKVKPDIYLDDLKMTDFSPVMIELRELNQKGFQIVSHSNSTLNFNSDANTSRPYHSFLLVKK